MDVKDLKKTEIVAVKTNLCQRKILKNDPKKAFTPTYGFHAHFLFNHYTRIDLWTISYLPGQYVSIFIIFEI